MKVVKYTRKSTLFVTAFVCFVVIFAPKTQAKISGLIDDFSHATNNSLDVPRQFFSDAMSGGTTSFEQRTSSGVLSLRGNIEPSRGQLGWMSTVLMLDSHGLPHDLSKFHGIRLRIKLETGNLSVSANSTEVTNFDYHSTPITVKSDGNFHDIEVPFSALKRTWSEQTKLNTHTIASISIVAWSPQSAPFALSLDSVELY